jgi:hypothetical protein
MTNTSGMAVGVTVMGIYSFGVYQVFILQLDLSTRY